MAKSFFDLSNIWLKSNYFFLTNKEYFKKWWVIVLIALDVFVVIFVLANTILFLLSIPKVNRVMIDMANSPIDYSAIRERHTPLPLGIVSSRALPSGKNKYDFYTQIINNNTDWAVAEIYYKFNYGNESTEVFTDFIMPSSNKYLVVNNITIPQNPDSGEIKLPPIAMSIEDITWKRAGDLAKLAEQNFQIEDVKYSSASSENTVAAHWVTASVTNNGFIGFWQTKFSIVIFNGDDVVGISQAFFNPFQAGETKSLYAQWDRVSGRVTNVLILPEINLLDQDNVI